MPMTEDSMKKRTTQDQSEYSGPLKWIDHNQNGIMDAYEDPRLPVEARIADLLLRLSIEEKIAYLCIDWTSGAPPAEATVPADTQRREGCTQFPASIGQAASWSPEYWINTYQGLVVPRVVMAFGVFLMRQFFQSIPKELEKAALASLPTLIVYLLFQRHFIKGIVMTGLKG
jgi:hypothetical protein